MPQLSAVGDLPVEDVWERYTRPALWSTWAPQITRVSTPDDVIRAGTRGTVHGPLLVRVPFRILSVDHGTRRWSWRAGLGPLGLVMDHGVDVEGDGSRAWVDIQAPGAIVAAYAPVARLALRRLVTAAQ